MAWFKVVARTVDMKSGDVWAFHELTIEAPNKINAQNVALDWVATPVNGLTMVDSAERTDAPVDPGYGFHV